MPQSRYLFWLTLGMFCLIVFSCSADRRPPPPPALVFVPPAPPQPTWSGAQVAIAVASFEVDVNIPVQIPETVRSAKSRNPLGRGMEERLVSALKETKQFLIAEPTVIAVALRGKKTAEYVSTRIGNLEGAEFFITGTLHSYRPSRESLAAGIAADPLLNLRTDEESEIMAETARTTFALFTPASKDIVTMTIRLIDATTGDYIGETLIEASAQDLDTPLGGIFGPMLLQGSEQLETPMQKTVRAGVIKAVNWIADACLAHRRTLALNTTP